MTWTVERHEWGSMIELRCRGELDLGSAPLLDATLRGCSAGDVVIDLSDVTLIDASGCRVLIHAARTLHSDGRSLSVIRPTPLVRQVLDVVNLAWLIAGSDHSATNARQRSAPWRMCSHAHANESRGRPRYAHDVGGR